MTGLVTTTREELGRTLSVPPVFATLVLAVLLYSVFYPQPYLNEALRDVPIALVDLDRTPTSRELARQIDAAEFVAIERASPDFVSAERLVFARDVSGILVIPQYFERELLHGRASPIALYSDASYFLIYSRIATGINSVARAFGANIEAGRLIAAGVDPSIVRAAIEPITLTTIPLFNPQGGYATYLLPAAFVLILQQALLIGVGLLGTLPGNRHGASFGPVTFVLGRQAAYLLISAISFSFYLIVLPFLYGVPRLGSFGTIALVCLPFILSVSALAMSIAYIAVKPAAVQLLIGGIGLPFMFMTGFSWPLEAIPASIKLVSNLVPTTFGIDGIVRVAQMGASLSDVHQQLTALWIQALGYTALAMLLELRRGRDTGEIASRPAGRSSLGAVTP